MSREYPRVKPPREMDPEIDVWTSTSTLYFTCYGSSAPQINGGVFDWLAIRTVTRRRGFSRFELNEGASRIAGLLLLELEGLVVLTSVLNSLEYREAQRSL
jgi:hypothetical protein